MNLVVLVREIWDTRDLSGEILDSQGLPRWQEWEGRFDPEDLNALEMALQLKDNQGGTVTAVSSGRPRKLDVLRESLYRSVDQTIRLVDADGTPTILSEAHMVAAALHKLDTVDILFTGIQLNEVENAQRGAMVARILDWPLVSYVEAVDSMSGSRIQLRRAIEGGTQLVEAVCPVVVSVGVALVKDDPRAPRSARAKLKLKHKKTLIAEWGTENLAALKGKTVSPVRVLGYKTLEQREFPARRIDGSSGEELKRMVDDLREQGLVR
jgi:electron transfer flavoprotein beta subunit